MARSLSLQVHCSRVNFKQPRAYPFCGTLQKPGERRNYTLQRGQVCFWVFNHCNKQLKQNACIQLFTTALSSKASSFARPTVYYFSNRDS